MKNGTIRNDSQAKSDILDMQLSSVFTDGHASNVPSLSPYSQLPHTRVYVSRVRTLLAVIKPQTVTGRNVIPPRLQKDYDTDLAPVLSHFHQA